VSDTARSAGRGGVLIAGAKIYFILTGLVQQIVLKHVIGLGAYGDLGDVQSFASVLYNPVVSTSVQGVSRAVSSSNEDEQPAAQRRALSVHWATAVPIAVALFFLAPTIAEIKHIPHLTLALRLIAVVMFAYGLYTPLIGAVNGQKRFSWQAGFDVIAATLRTAGLVGGAWYFVAGGRGVEGALGGFAISAALMVAIALPVAGVGRRGTGGPPMRRYLLFVAPLFGGHFLLNLLMQADLQLLSVFAGDAAQTAGLGVEEAGKLKGAYRAAQLFCFLPYQLLLSVAFVLFPLLASAQRDGDMEAVARYVRSGVRLALVIAGMVVSVTAGLSGPLLTLIFGADTAEIGARPMFIMALGLGAFAVFGILTTVLNSLERAGTAAILTGVALSLVVTLCFVLVRNQPFGADMLMRTAMSMASGLALAAVLAALAVKRLAKAVAPFATLLRVGVALPVAIAVGRYLPAPGKVMTLVYSAVVVIIYLLVLLVTRELTKTDLDMVKTIAKPKR
jgi:stage V sporulation protein B